MPQLEFFLVARAVSVDANTNQLSVFEVLEEVHPQQLPARIEQCVAVSTWRLGADDTGTDALITLRITRPGGEAQDLSSTVRFPEGSARHRLMQRIQGLSLNSSGNLHFELLLNGQHSAQHLVTVLAPEAACANS